MQVPRVVLASANAGKLLELTAMLASHGMDVVPQSDFEIPSIEETGESFVENAIIKARHAARLCCVFGRVDAVALGVCA